MRGRTLPIRRAALPRCGGGGGQKTSFAPGLRAHVLRMDVLARLDVVYQVPSRMVGVLVDDEVIATIPAPVGANRPLPGRHFKIEPSREPETVRAHIDPHHVVVVARPEMLEVPVRERVLQYVPLVARAGPPVPLVVAHVLRLIDFSGWRVLVLRLLLPV